MSEMLPLKNAEFHTAVSIDGLGDNGSPEYVMSIIREINKIFVTATALGVTVFHAEAGDTQLIPWSNVRQARYL